MPAQPPEPAAPTGPPPSGRYLVGLIGTGIRQSLSPRLHEREADHHGLRYYYQLIDLADLGLPGSAVGELTARARQFGFSALNITHPCKQLVMEHLDELAPDAASIGAVNTVVFRDGLAIGHNTDATGFARSFERTLPDAKLDRVVQLGAGGAGAAVAYALLTLGASSVTLVDLDDARAEALAARLRTRFGPDRARGASLDALPGHLRHADGLVNATPVGMASHPGSPVPAGMLDDGLWVADVVYLPLETELLRLARARGCRTLDGTGMAVVQAAEAFRLITGRVPDVDRMLAHLRELVAARGTPRTGARAAPV